jgi:hypothetical protein
LTPVWRKSSRSGTGGNQSDCVEVAALTSTVGVRDSKAPGTGHLSLGRTEFAALVQKIKNDRLDL